MTSDDDSDVWSTIIGANVAGEPDSDYEGIGKWIAVLVLVVCVMAAAMLFTH